MRFLKWFVFIFVIIMFGIGIYCLNHSYGLEAKQNMYIDAKEVTVEISEFPEDMSKLKLDFVNMDSTLVVSRSVYPELTPSTSEDGNIGYSTVRIPNNSQNLIVLNKELHATEDTCYRNGVEETGVSVSSVKKISYANYLELLNQYNGNLGNIDIELKRYNLLTLWGFCASGVFCLLFFVLAILTRKEKKIKQQQTPITSEEIIAQMNTEKQMEEDRLARIQQRKDELNKNILIAEEKAKKSWSDATPQEKSDDLVVTEFTPDSSVSNEVEVFEFQPSLNSDDVVVKAKETVVEELNPVVDESTEDSMNSMFATDDDFSVDDDFSIDGKFDI